MKKRISFIIAVLIILVDFNNCSFSANAEENTTYLSKSNKLMLFNNDLSVKKLNKVNFSEDENFQNYQLEVYDKYIDEETGEEYEILTPALNNYVDNLEKGTYKRKNANSNKFNILDSKEYSVGETRSFYNGIDSERLNIECKYVGEHCTVWTDTRESTLDILKLSSDNAKIIADYFDSKYDIVNNMFGNYINISKKLSNNKLEDTFCGDADNDNKLAIVCYDINDSYNDGNISSYIGGYYNSHDNYFNNVVDENSISDYISSDESFSNMIDCINIDTFPAMGSNKDNPFSNIERALSTLIHEYQHLIEASYIGEDVIFSSGRSLPPVFINEAFSMASEHLICGSSYTKSRIDKFNNNYEYGSSLTYWYTNKDDGDVLNNYANSYLFGQYLRTRYSCTKEASLENDIDGSTVYKKFLEYYSNIGAKEEDYYKYIEETFSQTIEDFVIDFWKAVFKNKESGNEGFNNEEWAKSIKPKEYVGGSILMTSLPIKNGGIWFFKDCKGIEINKSSPSVSIVELDDIILSSKVIIRDKGEIIDIQNDISDINQISWPKITDNHFIGFYSADDSLTAEETIFDAKRIYFNDKTFDNKEIEWFIDEDYDDSLNLKEEFSSYIDFRYKLVNIGPGAFTPGLPVSPGKYYIKWSIHDKLYGLKEDLRLEVTISDNRHIVTYRQFLNNGDSYIGTEIKSIPLSTEEEVIENMPTHLDNIDGYTFLGWAGCPSKIKEEDITLVTIYVKNSSIDFYKEKNDNTNVEIIINGFTPDMSYFKYKNEKDESYNNGLPPYDYGVYDVTFDTNNYLSGVNSNSDFGLISFKVNVKKQDYYIRWKDFSGNTQHELVYSDDLTFDFLPEKVEGYDSLGWFGDISKGEEEDTDIYSVYRSNNLFKVYDGNPAVINYNIDVKATYTTYKYDINKNKYIDNRCIGTLPTLPGIYYIESYVKLNDTTKKDSFIYEISTGNSSISFLDFYGNEFQRITVNSYTEFDLDSIKVPEVEGYKFIGFISNIYDLHDIDLNGVKYQTVYVKEIVKKQKDLLNFKLNIDNIDTGYNNSTKVEYLYNNSETIPNDVGVHAIDINLYLLNDKQVFLSNSFNITILNNSFNVTFKNPITGEIYKTQNNIQSMDEIIPPDVKNTSDKIFLGFSGEITNENYNDLIYNAVFINSNINRKDVNYTENELFEYNYNNLILNLIYESTYWEIDSYEYLNDNYEGSDFEIDVYGRKRRKVLKKGFPSSPGIYEITIPDAFNMYGYFNKKTFNITISFKPYKITCIGLDGSIIYEADRIQYKDDLHQDISDIMDIYSDNPFIGILEEIPLELKGDFVVKGVYLKDCPKDTVINKEINISTNISGVKLETLYENILELGSKDVEIPSKSGLYNIYISAYYNDKFIGEYYLENIAFKNIKKVSLVSNDDDNNNEIIFDNLFIDDLNAEEIVLPNGPDKKGYKFIGWYDEKNDIIVDGNYLKDYILNGLENELRLKALYEQVYITIYRLYNPNSGEHLFTAKKSEYDKLEKVGWHKEGITFDAYYSENAPEDAKPLYRVYNPNGLNGLGDHHYTTKLSEVLKLVKMGWSLDNNEKPIFYVCGDIPVYRAYNINTGAHHYTPKLSELNKLVDSGWVNENIGWCVNGYYDSKGNRITN